MHEESECIAAVSARQVSRFQPQPSWFQRDSSGIHGIAHETRVLIWTQVLAIMAAEEGLNVDPNVLGWAAIIHDTQRWNDGIDAQHGARAAAWIGTHPNLIPQSVTQSRVMYLCRWHVPPDNMAPEMTDELRVFKDADALDRWRICDLDPSYLRTQSALRLMNASYSLWAATADPRNPTLAYCDILSEAVSLGVLVDDL